MVHLHDCDNAASRQVLYISTFSTTLGAGIIRLTSEIEFQLCRRKPSERIVQVVQFPVGLDETGVTHSVIEIPRFLNTCCQRSAGSQQ